jgi:multiple sugar transport system substrate-binding protein
MKKLISLLLAATLVMTTFAGCGKKEVTDNNVPSTGSQSEQSPEELKGEITFMVIDSFTKDENSALYTTTKEFMEKYPGIKVTIEPTAATNIKDKFTTSALSGAGPDIVALDSAGWAVDAAAANLILPLDEDLAEIKDQFQEGPLNSALYNGHYYAVPWYMNNMGLFYNKTILKDAGVDKVPTTWEEFTDALVKVEKIGKKGIVLPYFFPSYCMYAFFYQNGNPVIDTSGDKPVSALMDDSGKEAFRYICDFHTKYNAFPESLKDATSWDQTYAPFLREEVAFLFCGDWAYWSLQDSGVDYGIAPLPAGKQPATVLGGYTLSINSNTDNYKAAWEYVKWLTAKEQNDVLLSYGRVGARKDIDSAALIEQSPHLEQFIAQNSYTMARPAIVRLAEFDEMFSNAYKEVILNLKTADEALEDLDAKVNDFLDKLYQ